jgi:hypothetical protein
MWMPPPAQSRDYHVITFGGVDSMRGAPPPTTRQPLRIGIAIEAPLCRRENECGGDPLVREIEDFRAANVH